MACKRIEESATLYCYKVTYTGGKIFYYIDVSMEDAIRSANEIDEVKIIEFVGEGAIGD